MNVEDLTIYWYEIHELYQEIRRLLQISPQNTEDLLRILKF